LSDTDIFITPLEKRSNKFQRMTTYSNSSIDMPACHW
jgi:hypothetical protein